jgi:hypothetical protein
MPLRTLQEPSIDAFGREKKRVRVKQAVSAGSQWAIFQHLSDCELSEVVRRTRVLKI